MKKIIKTSLVAIALLSFVACDPPKKDNNEGDSTTKVSIDSSKKDTTKMDTSKKDTSKKM